MPGRVDDIDTTADDGDWLRSPGSNCPAVCCAVNSKRKP
jgi:hypothetical protein